MTARDNVAVTHLELHDNGRLVQQHAGPTLSGTISYQPADNGPHTLDLQARDAAGNVQTQRHALQVNVTPNASQSLDRCQLTRVSLPAEVRINAGEQLWLMADLQFQAQPCLPDASALGATWRAQGGATLSSSGWSGQHQDARPSVLVRSGTTPGELTLTLGGLSASTKVHAQSPGGDPFNLTLRWMTPPPSAEYQATVEQAARRWESVITQGLPSSRVLIGDQEVVVDDVLVSVYVEPMTPVMAGYAGPLAMREVPGGKWLPATGEMRLSLSSMDHLEEAPQLLSNLVTHELGHVLGLGTLWEGYGTQWPTLLDPPNCSQTTGPVAYIGAQAVQAYRALGGGHPGVPLAETGGRNRCTHWHEAQVAGEVMGPSLSRSKRALSVMTLAALEDLGYQVNRAAADPYQLPTGMQAAADPPGPAAAESGNLLVERLLFPDVLPTRP
ncbi:hypothetical protein QOL99_05555 [Deinococcus sp. MIMF12]|uniref:Peptidase M10 metallopeptidase domain-containing protein n=1 Tax=Deinococcus rhizophilus TaxID=3049544 RepID=A0ABT7JEX9_9DEIO|nr:hypothetical protein [Deinococcus rhizophilus]MDL2343615.1 hypothetical protein [Deinococcus rhizophilus]